MLSTSQKLILLNITITDQQTDINSSLIFLFDPEGNPIAFTANPISFGYEILASASPNITSFSEVQGYFISVSDSYDNVNSTTFLIFTDISSPRITSTQIKGESDDIFANIPLDYVTQEPHTLIIEYDDDSGTINSGINNANTEISLSFSKDGISFSNVNFANDDKYNIDITTASSTTIYWETSLGSKEVPEGVYKWSITIFDNVGHESTKEITYTITYDRPSLIDQIISLGTTLALSLGVFGALGIGVAYIYERIRYEK